MRRLLAVLSLLALLLAAPASASSGQVGAKGGGDPYFPRQGNGGYDAQSYALRVAYDPASHHLSGVASVRAIATHGLSQFDLDLRRTMVVSAVSVNGVRAGFAQPAALVQELVIVPGQTLAAGREFTVQVTYAGTATPTYDPDGSIDGFFPTGDGAVALSEPQGSPTWFPVNDSPYDKATYWISATVPAPYVAVSNGVLQRHSGTTWSWYLDRPVSSYLVTLAIGRYRVVRGMTPVTHVPYFTAVDPAQSSALVTLRRLPAIVDYFSSAYGAYPFPTTGAIVLNDRSIGYALECATRPVFDSAPSEGTLAHELAHQWFGDTVTLSRWRDIWLNEGFAEFSAWLWGEHTGGPSAHARLAQLLALPASDTDEWNPPPGNPGAADEIFAGSVYDRGAATLQALREKVGSATFFRILRGWVSAHRYGNAKVPQFVAYASSVAGVDLTHFFTVWLYRTGKPSGW